MRRSVIEAAPIATTRVLLVEDEIADAQIVQRSLRRGGRSRDRFALEHVATLAKGIDQLHRSAVDVLLLDLCLPDSEGVATVARLRERDHDVPLVVLTGDDDPRLVAHAFEAGADEYLVKSDLHRALLRRTIRHAIERRRTRRAADPGSPALAPQEECGGLLHELKGLLTSILGNARIIQRDTPAEGFPAQRVAALLGAARGAVDLVRRVAGDEAVEEAVRAIELSEFVRCEMPALRAALPERVDLRLDLATKVPPVSICPEAMRCVVLELVMNAVEAIGDAPGCVEIRTGQALLSESEVAAVLAPAGMSMRPGPHTWLEVRGEGAGIGEARPARLGDRGAGRGATRRGDGLGPVHAFLARYRAGLLVRSQPHLGAAFRILLPAEA